MPTTRNDSSTTEEERHSKPPQSLKGSATEKFMSIGAVMEERPLVAICENAAKTPVKETQKLSSNTETQDEPHMEETVDLVQNDGTEKSSDHDKNNDNNSNAKARAVDVEQSDVPDCVSGFDGNGAYSCVLVSGLKDVLTEHEIKFDEDRDYSYNWMDDMWTAYGARPRTRDERDYEAEMERVQAEYEMEFELNRCNPYSLMIGSPKDDTRNENASELEHSDEVGNRADGAQSQVAGKDDFEAYNQDVSYSEGSSDKNDESEETSTDDAQCEVTGEGDFEVHSDGSYSGEGSGAEDTQSEMTGDEVQSDDSYSEGSSSFDDDESDESDTDEDEETDYERDEYERAKRKEMDIIRWIETVNKALFPHLVNNLESHAAVKEGQALGLTEFLTSTNTGLDDVQRAVSEGEVDQEARSDGLYRRKGSQRTQPENKSEEANEETRSETTDVQSAVTEDQEAHSDRHLIMNVSQSAESDYEEESEETRSGTTDVQSAVTEDQEAHSDRHLIMNGSQSAESDYEEESEETRSATTDVQSAVIRGETSYNGTSGDSHSWENRSKTRDDREYEKAVCSLTDPVMYGENQPQERGVAYGVVTANDELLPKLKTGEMENNAPGVRGGLGRGFARFSEAARRFFQRCVPRCCRGNSE